MAAWTQFSVGVLLDTLIVRLGFWVYRPMEFSLAGVPLDLHVNWALIWGFVMVWLFARLHIRWRQPRFIALYLSLWVLFTVAFDLSVSGYSLFLKRVSPLWWLVDAIFLFVVLGSTLWVYHSILFPARSPLLCRWSCRVRSFLYVSSLAYVFYGYLPSVVLSLTSGWGASPLLGLEDPRVLGLALLPPLFLGTWATLIFTDQGAGTPLPLDPPLRLVTSGPYAFVRNPMQIAGMMLAVLLVLYYPTKFMLFYVADMALTSVVLINLFEHSQMQQMFSRSYESYSSQVRNWVPRLTRYSSSGTEAS
jgi:protein-S-isoprenylcysteine O-methyltransferase Ste14